MTSEDLKLVKEELEEIEEEKEEKEEKEEVSEEKKEEVSLEDKITSLKEALANEKNNFLKAHADLENTKKRLTNDFNKRSKFMMSDFILELLPVVDNIEKVIADLQDSDNKVLLEAMEMINRQLQGALDKEGVEEISALNEKFDPTFHHAVLLDEVDGVESDIVVEVFQKGYKIKDRILRASMVKVSK